MPALTDGDNGAVLWLRGDLPKPCRHEGHPPAKLSGPSIARASRQSVTPVDVNIYRGLRRLATCLLEASAAILARSP